MEMGTSSYNFESLVKLPSNGLIKNYSKYTYIKTITNNYFYIYFIINHFSLLEKYIAIVKEFTRIKKPENLIVNDFYYLLLNIFLNAERKVIFDTFDVCDSCGHLNQISVKTSEFGIIYLDETILKNKSFFYLRDNEIKIYLKFFLVKDLYELFLFNLSNFSASLEEEGISQEKESFSKKESTRLEKLTLRNKLQIEKIELLNKSKKEIISSESEIEFFLNEYLNFNEQIYIFQKINEFNKSWGLNDLFKYNCKNCEKENTSYFFEEKYITLPVPKKGPETEILASELNFCFLLNYFNVMSFSEWINFPYALREDFMKIFKKIIDENKNLITLKGKGLF